ncbi:hypothetical protein P154DRAFT_323938 [Amniculicola lignicola CBS 123094]|uniref:Uncharacterized protein n=1 Tax=Amniculicola lignicola CBS 123094 TaxID=1392246 RepID=A0A6A5WEW2_9PLEO|nr:hypothetical protein P154DRAFT_323938 [Amniculicola lignicola CBS 123094]
MNHLSPTHPLIPQQQSVSLSQSPPSTPTPIHTPQHYTTQHVPAKKNFPLHIQSPRRDLHELRGSGDVHVPSSKGRVSVGIRLGIRLGVGVSCGMGDVGASIHISIRISIRISINIAINRHTYSPLSHSRFTSFACLNAMADCSA